MTEIPNLDAMDEEELVVAQNSFYSLCQYAAYKRHAVMERKAARIESALLFERGADNIYEEIPEEYRW
jgi:hypothetical protein